MDLSTKFGKEIPSRNPRKKGSETVLSENSALENSLQGALKGTELR